MSTLAVPVFVRVTACACLLPTVIEPNVSLVGFSDKDPTGAAVPVPAGDAFVTASEALLETDRVALNAPAAFGENVTLTGVLCPAAIVAGRLGAFKEKYFVEIAALLTTTELLPLFVAVTVMVLLVPACTLPKSSPDVAKERTLE